MPIFEDPSLQADFAYDGCTQFARVDSFHRVSVLPDDALSGSVNMDVDQGSIATRRGVEELGSGLPATRVQGIGFLDRATPTFLQNILAVINGAAYRFDGSTWSAVSGYAAPSMTQRVKIVPLVDRLYLASQGGNLYSWDGTTMTALTTGAYPPKQYSILCKHTFRLFGAGIADKPDTLECSDILDGSVWKPLTNSSRVGGGESDPITALCSWSNYQLVVGKRSSIYLVDCDPTLTPANWNMKSVTDAAGCVAQDTMRQIGDDVAWLARDGVRTLQYTLQGLTQGVDEPISRPIQDVIDRINWTYVDRACACYWRNRYLLSVPLDASTDNNAVLVYNTQTKGWSGYWTGWAATGFIPTFFGNNARLVMGRSDGRVAQWMDYVPASNEQPSNYTDLGLDIASTSETRGLTCSENLSPKQGFHAEVEFWKSAAFASVNVRLDGGAWAPFWNGTTLGVNGSLIGNPLPWQLNTRSFWRIARDLIRFGSWREIQFQFVATSGKLQVRSLYLSARVEKFNAEIN